MTFVASTLHHSAPSPTRSTLFQLQTTSKSMVRKSKRLYGLVVLMLLECFWLSLALSQTSPTSRNPSTLRLLAKTLNALNVSTEQEPITTARMKGMVSSADVTSKRQSVSVVYDTQFTSDGVEFKRVHRLGPNKSSVASDYGQETKTSKKGVQALPGLYRYVLQPDYIPATLLLRAYLDPTQDVVLRGRTSVDGRSIIELSTSSGATTLGRTTFKRLWTVDEASGLPLSSTVCVPSASAIQCRLHRRSHYSDYVTLSGILTPRTVRITLNDRDKAILTVTGIDLGITFPSKLFIPEAPDDVNP